MRRLVCVLLLLAAMLAVSPAVAQNPPVRRLPTRYYPPAGPPLSPYLNLFRRDGGPIDNYNFFVRPRQQLQREMQQQNAAIQSLNRSVQGAQQQLQQRAVQAAPTGKSATFMNYSHYYQLGR